jgi:hypothetical protein
VSRKPLTDVAASIRQRLLNRAKANGDDYQRILTRYAIERLLYRLCQTEARDSYVLKGAMLFVTWPDQAFRPTGDLDMLGHGDMTPEGIAALFTRICQIEVPDDGIAFDADTLKVEVVREAEKYQGTRLSVRGYLGKTEVPVQIDLGFGDRVHPVPTRRTFPGLLPELPAADVLMYPPETVVAEKFEAMIRFAEENGRIKDFHDIWVITQTFEFDMGTLAVAIGGTMKARQTDVPTETPPALTPAFAARPEKQAMWTAFLRRTPPTTKPPPLDELLAHLRGFIGPVLAALALPQAGHARWNPDRGVWEDDARAERTMR